MELKHAFRKVAILKVTKLGIGMATVAALSLTGCNGGSSSSAPAASTLGGVAAVGDPIVNGNISVNCAAGSALATTTNSTGAWLVTLSGQTLPCAVQVSSGTINNAANTAIYHSIATSEGTINVTPLTDLMVANLAGTATPSVWFGGLNATPAPLAAISQANVDAALTKLRTALNGLPSLNTVNPITTTFTPAPGNVGDDILAALKTAMTSTGVTHEAMLNNASLPAFTAFVTGFDTALTAAYSGTASGSPTSTSTSTSTPTANPFINSSWSGTATVTNSNANNGCTSSTWTATIDSTGVFAGSTSTDCGDTAILVGTVDSSGTTSFGYAGGVCTFSGQFSVSPTSSASGTFTCSDAGVSASGTWSGTGSGGSTSGNNTSGGQTAGTLMGGAIQGTPLNLTGTVTTFAGAGGGYADGTGTAALFNNPLGIATDGTNLYVVESQNRKIRKIVIATGAVTTLAGSGSSGAADGTGTAASFNSPHGITTDGSNLYVTDNNNIRKIVIATGAVTTLAGSGSMGFADGTGTAASFFGPDGITTDGSNLYVADSLNRRIRKIVIATGAVTTFAGSGSAGWADGTGTAASFGTPRGITTDGSNLYVADELNSDIRKIVIATGAVSTLAGSARVYGSADGTGTAATFNGLRAITTDGSNLYVADGGYPSGYIRKIVIATGVVSTPTVWWAQGITTDGSNLYVTNNTLIGKIQ